MGPVVYVLLALAFLILLIIALNIKIVPQSRAYVIERLGAYSATWQTGLHMKIPVFERVATRLADGVYDVPQPKLVAQSGASAARLHGDLWSGNLLWDAVKTKYRKGK